MADEHVLSTRQSRLIAHIQVLGHRNFRLLFVGQTTSALGSVIQSVALSWLVLDLTGSALALGGALLTATVPSIITSPIGGLLSDRFGPRPVMIWADAIRAVCIATLALLVAGHGITMPLLYGLLTISGAAGGTFAPAANSMPPILVPAERLATANSLNQSAAQLAMILGAPLGGVIVATLGTAGAIVLNAATFAVSSLAVLTITHTQHDTITPAAAATPRPTTRAMAVQALYYLRTSPWLACLLAIDGVLTIAAVGPLAVGLPLLARNNTTGSPIGLGVMLSAMGAGATLGMLWAGTHGFRKHRGIWFALVHIPQAIALATIPHVALPIAAALLATIGILSGWGAITYLVIIQSTVPGHLMGRVMSLVAMASTGLAPLSQAAASITAQLLTTPTMLLAAGTLMALTALAGLTLAPLRRLQ